MAYKLFSDGGKAAKERKERFAGLVERMADCTKEIGDSIFEGKHPAAQCSELSGYLDNIQTLAAEITDEETAAKLMYWVRHVTAVPGVAQRNIERELLSDVKPSISRRKRYLQSREILGVSGNLKAVANLLRV